MKFQTCASTPGLDRYPERERFAAWKTAHKKLLREDPVYRKRHRNYLFSELSLTFLLCAVSMAMPHGFVGIALMLFTMLCLSAVVVYLPFRYQDFVNQRVGGVLQASHASGGM